MIKLEFDALLFDLDGTLVDSSEVIHRAWSTFALKYQIDVDEMLRAIQGKPAQESIASLRPTASRDEVVQDAKWLETMESEDTDGVIALPGSVELLNNLNAQSIPWAIVTSGTVPVATARIQAVNLPLPSVLVTPERVDRGKPDPEPYLLAASQLGVDASRCIVFEDAPAGIESGNRAGAKTVGVLTQFTSAELHEKEADFCVSTLQEVSISIEENRQILSIRENAS